LTTCFDRLRLKRPSLVLACWAFAFVVFLCGCRGSHYRRTADNQAYGAIQKVQAEVLGETNTFSIDTAYSSRKPEEITPEELIGSRTETNQLFLTLEAAIDLAIDNSRDYQSAKEDLYATALNLSNVRYAVGRSITPRSVTTADWRRQANGQESSALTTENGITVSQLFSTGGRMTVSALNSVRPAGTLVFAAVRRAHTTPVAGLREEQS
jgi:hypothetical protein